MSCTATTGAPASANAGQPDRRLAPRAHASRRPGRIFAMVGRVDPPPPPGVSSLRIAWLRFGLMRVEALLSHLGAVVVPSHALARFLAEHGFPRRRMHVIPNGVPVRRFVPGALHASAAGDRRDPRAAEGDRRPPRRTGGDAATGGARRLRRRLATASARRTGESSRHLVRFHGLVYDLRDRLLELDVFVLATRAENLPVAILEAMAIGLPVVATACPTSRVGVVLDPRRPGISSTPTIPARSGARSTR